MPCSPDAPRGPEGQGDGGNRRGRIPPRGRAREALREKLSPTLQKSLSFIFPDIAKTAFFHIAKTAFPSLATRVEKPSTKNPRGAFPMTTVPGVSAARFAQLGHK